jgi:hypothetical protein
MTCTERAPPLTGPYACLQIKSMTSESSTTIDKRIISKLLLTYFERHGSRDVLTLMTRMLVGA